MACFPIMARKNAIGGWAGPAKAFLKDCAPDHKIRGVNRRREAVGISSKKLPA